MGRISDTDRSRNEEAIRAAMDRLLRGDVPPGGRCDLKTLAAEAGVTRTGFYQKRDRDGSIREGPYQHLGDEFVRRLAALRAAGEVPDPRDAQIERLKAQNAELKNRVVVRDEAIAELTDFSKRALSCLAAQHDEIRRLRSSPADAERTRTPPNGMLMVVPQDRNPALSPANSPSEAKRDRGI